MVSSPNDILRLIYFTIIANPSLIYDARKGFCGPDIPELGLTEEAIVDFRKGKGDARDKYTGEFQGCEEYFLNSLKFLNLRAEDCYPVNNHYRSEYLFDIGANILLLGQSGILVPSNSTSISPLRGWTLDEQVNSLIPEGIYFIRKMFNKFSRSIGSRYDAPQILLKLKKSSYNHISKIIRNKTSIIRSSSRLLRRCSCL